MDSGSAPKARDSLAKPRASSTEAEELLAAAREIGAPEDDLVRRLLEVSPIPTLIVSADATHRIEHMNRSFTEMFGYTFDHIWDVASWWPHAYPNPTYRAEIERSWVGAIARAHTLGRSAIEPVEATVCCLDGSRRHVQVHMGMCGAHAIVLFSDFTEKRAAELKQRELETQMRQARNLESLSVLAGGLAHDFNNLLTVILGNLSLVQEELAADSRARSCLADVEVAALRAKELTHRMLIYSGRGPLVDQFIDLASLVSETRPLLDAAIAKQARLTLALDKAAVQGDAAQLRQLLLGLLTNAAESLAEVGGSITLKTGVVNVASGEAHAPHLQAELPPGEYAYLEVSDTGRGIPPEIRSRIFEPFFTTKFAGRGLGLAAVHGIVRGHRGGLSVTSEIGKGTRIRALFPKFLDDRAGFRIPSDPAPRAEKAPLVLVIDDEEAVRRVVRRALERAGFDVLVAPDGPTGLDILAESGPDIAVLVLDMIMPGMDGREVLARLPLTRSDMPVVLVSGFGTEAPDLEGYRQPIAFLPKPFDLAVLVAKVGELAES